MKYRKHAFNLFVYFPETGSHWEAWVVSKLAV